MTFSIHLFFSSGCVVTAHSRQKDHRSDGCSHSKRKINAFDDLYDGTIIYPVRGIDRILNQR